MGVVNIIFDDRNTPQDKERLIGEFAEQGIVDYKFWQAVVIKDKPIVDSIAASHKMIVQDAKDKGLKECIIMEQDATFTSPNAWKYFLEQKPERFDLYLWGSYIVPLSNNCVNGFQLYIISERFFSEFLATPENKHIDSYMDEIKGDYHFCYPFPCLQRAGFSINNNSIVNYNAILQPEDIYKG